MVLLVMVELKISVKTGPHHCIRKKNKKKQVGKPRKSAFESKGHRVASQQYLKQIFEKKIPSLKPTNSNNNFSSKILLMVQKFG